MLLEGIIMNLILASASPRRQELLKLFGVPFTVRVADIDETMDLSRPAYDEVARVSRLKALAIPRQSDDVIIAADTIVVCEGKVLGKPRDEADAAATLRLLSGRDHQVMTGCTILCGDRCESFTEVTDLHFRELSEKEIARYVASGEPMDKAGSYGIQGGAALFCTHMVGDYYNVMGLPVCALGLLLKRMAPQLMEETL
jgi:septum formation protein